jgi:hypothetical protein
MHLLKYRFQREIRSDVPNGTYELRGEAVFTS